MNPKEIGLIAGGAALALVLGLGAGGVARAPMIRALTPHPMAATPGTQELAANVPSEEAPPAPPPSLPAKWETRDETPTAYVSPAPEPQDARADAKDAADQGDADPAPGVQARAPGQDYSRRSLGGPEEVTPDYTPPPAYDWPSRRPPPSTRPPPPPPYYYDSPDDGPGD